MLFDSAGDFERARALLRQDPEAFHLGNSGEPYLIARKADIPRLAETGLAFRRVELVDADTLSPEERYERQRAMIQSEAVRRRKAEMLERLGRQP